MEEPPGVVTPLVSFSFSVHSRKVLYDNRHCMMLQSTKGGKKSKSKAAKLILGKETDDAFVEGGYDDYDDFI